MILCYDLCMEKKIRQRKLVRKDILDRAVELKELGVPTTKIVKEFSLDISCPAMAKLITYRMAGNVHAKSLFPDWLDNSPEAPTVQSTPLFPNSNSTTYAYIGEFPLGRWQPESR